MRYVTVGCYCTSVMCLCPWEGRMTRLSSWQCSAVQTLSPEPLRPFALPFAWLAVRHDGIILSIHHSRRCNRLLAQDRLTPEPASQPENESVPNRPGLPASSAARVRTWPWMMRPRPHERTSTPASKMSKVGGQARRSGLNLIDCRPQWTDIRVPQGALPGQ